MVSSSPGGPLKVHFHETNTKSSDELLHWFMNVGFLVHLALSGRCCGLLPHIQESYFSSFYQSPHSLCRLSCSFYDTTLLSTSHSIVTLAARGCRQHKPLRNRPKLLFSRREWAAIYMEQTSITCAGLIPFPSADTTAELTHSHFTTCYIPRQITHTHSFAHTSQMCLGCLFLGYEF